MKILKLVPVAFGKFHAKEPMELSPGLNLILGGNEAGKSTLQAFILGMLYGFKREGVTRTRRTEDFDRYRPWSGRDYAGIMVYEHAGRRYRVERSFDPDVTVICDDETGEDLTSTFTQDTRKEYDFARRHTGLSCKEFVNTVWVGQLRTRHEEGFAGEIQVKILNLSGDDAEEIPVSGILGVLEAERRRIGTGRTTSGALNRLAGRIGELEREREAAEIRESQVREFLSQASTLSREKEEREAAARELEKRALAVRLELLARRVSQIRETEFRMKLLRSREAELKWAEGADEESAARIGALQARLAELQRSRLSLESRIQELETQRADLTARIEELRSVADLRISETEVASTFAAYTGLKAARSQAERKLAGRKQEEERLLGEMRARGIDSQAWFEPGAAENVERLGAAVEEAESSEREALSKLAELRESAASIRPGAAASWWYFTAVACALAALIATFLSLPWSWGAFAASLLLFGLGTLRYAAAARRRDMVSSRCREQEQKVREARAESERALRALEDLLARYGVSTVAEFRRKWNAAVQYREKIQAVRRASAEALEEMETVSRDLSRVETEVRRWLEASGCIARGEAVHEGAVEELCRMIREVRAAAESLRRVEREIEETILRLNETDEQISRLYQERAAILEEHAVTSEAELEDKVRASRELVDVRKELAGCQKNLETLLSGRTREDLERELETLRAKAGGPCPLEDAETVTERDLEDLRGKLDELRREIAGIQERIGRLQEAIELRSREGRSLAEVTEELAELYARRAALQEDAEALEIAREMIERLAGEMRREFAPRLARRAGEILAEITGGRYGELKLTPELDMTVVVPETNKATGVTRLSAGTVDQAYLALRVALAEILSGRRDFPLFLDDSFVQYDEERLRGVLRVLGRLCEEHQIVLFSCHGRERMLLDEMKLPCRVVELVKMPW